MADDLDLTDDFLDSLDTLTTICVHEGKRPDSGEYPATATEEEEEEYATSGGGGGGPNGGAEYFDDVRLSEFTPEELYQFGLFEHEEDESATQPTAIAEEEEGEEEEGGEDDAFEQPEPSMVRRIANGALLGASEYDHADDETDEYADEVAQLDSSAIADMYASYYSDSLVKPSYQSDGTDRSYSFASECTDFSPVQSPQEVTLDQSYAQRLEASVRGDGTSSRHTHESHSHGDDFADGASDSGASGAMMSSEARPFTMDDLACFDPHFGRDVFLQELAVSFIDGSGSRSLASYRMSTVFRISQNKSDIIKQGWLMKRGEFVRSWHKRWFTLRRMPQGPMLTYSRDSSENAPAKVIDLSSTSRCVAAPKPSKDHEFRIVTSADSKREYAAYAVSNYELTEWVRAIQSAINAGNKSAFEGAADLQRIWNETGIQGFLLRYGMRKVSSRNHMQTRVLELNFADQTIINSRRGESLSTLHFNDLVRVSPTKHGNEEFGLVLDFSGKHRSWALFLDTREARDDLLDILEKIAIKEVIGEDLEARCSRLRLKSGFLERRNVGPQATLKGRLYVCLYENSMVLYPDGEDVNSTRPWYVVTLKGLHVSCNEGKCTIAMGRLQLTCSSTEECRSWYQAILAAISLPARVVDLELRERAKIRNAFHSTVFRLRKLLKAHVKPEPNGPPKDQKTIELMMRKLWELTFVGEPFTSNADPRWQELGFQRGGPASDLRSSGLLGLYCLTYFVTHPSREFKRILDRTRFGVSEGDMKNYPLAIGCINVVAILTETLGFGDAGSHSEGCSPNAMKTFVRFIADTVAEPKRTPRPTRRDINSRSSMSGNSLESFDTWEDIVGEADYYVFEDMFCILYPILDMLFVEMGAGYMEFGQVVAAFRRRLAVIFDAMPRTMDELQELALEPVTEALVAPSIISKGMK